MLIKEHKPKSNQLIFGDLSILSLVTCYIFELLLLSFSYSFVWNEGSAFMSELMPEYARIMIWLFQL